jgi:hypothetical protein
MHQLEDHLQHRSSTSELAFSIRALNWDMHIDVLFIICCRTRLLGAHCTPLQFSFLNSFAKLWKASLSFVTSVRPPAWNNSIPTGRILMRLDIWAFFENLSRWFKFNWSPKRTGYFTWRRFHFYDNISLNSFGMIIFQIRVVEKIKIQLLCSVTFVRKACCLWYNV